MRRMQRSGLLAALTMTLFATGCFVESGDAGCLVYGQRRAEMPDPGGLAGAWLRWVNGTDAAMVGACR